MAARSTAPPIAIGVKSERAFSCGEADADCCDCPFEEDFLPMKKII
jgi:hypothetical protein